MRLTCSFLAHAPCIYYVTVAVGLQSRLCCDQPVDGQRLLVFFRSHISNTTPIATQTAMFLSQYCYTFVHVFAILSITIHF